MTPACVPAHRPRASHIAHRAHAPFDVRPGRRDDAHAALTCAPRLHVCVQYGPASAPGMRTRRVSIFKYLFRKKGAPHNPADIWQPGCRARPERWRRPPPAPACLGLSSRPACLTHRPVSWRGAGDGDVDGEGGADSESMAIASEILPPILELLPSLKSSDASESAAAAAEMVALTNNTSTEEDTLVGRSGALEVLGQVSAQGGAARARRACAPRVCARGFACGFACAWERGGGYMPDTGVPGARWRETK